MYKIMNVSLYVETEILIHKNNVTIQIVKTMTGVVQRANLNVETGLFLKEKHVMIKTKLIRMDALLFVKLSLIMLAQPLVSLAFLSAGMVLD